MQQHAERSLNPQPVLPPHYPSPNHYSSPNPNPNPASAAATSAQGSDSGAQQAIHAAVGATAAAGGLNPDPDVQNWQLFPNASVTATGTEQLAAQVNSLSWENAATRKIPMIRKIPAQHVRCEVCKIECNSEEVLNSHKQGKNHKKNLEKLKATLAPAPTAPAGVSNDPVIGSRKQQVLGQPIWCEICKIECNKETFQSHEQGNMHKKNLETLKAALAPAPIAPAGVSNKPIIGSHKQQVPAQTTWCEICKIECNSKEIFESHEQGKKHKKFQETLKAALVPAPVAPERVPNDPIIGSQTQQVPAQHIWCEICKIEFNNKEMLESHELGKKHKKNLETLKSALVVTPVAPAGVPNDPIIGSQTQKVPAQPIWCEICKIECNKEIFESHEQGKKNKKFLETLKAAVDPAPVAPAGVSNDPVVGSRKQKVFGQPIWCEICKIECNKETFQSHEQGNMHKKNLETLKAALAPAPIAPADVSNNPIIGSHKQQVPAQTIWCEICKIECNSKEIFESHEQGKKHKKFLDTLKAALVPAPVAPEGVPNDPIIGSQTQQVPAQHIWCEICKIEFNNKEMLESHELGKKHKKNLETLKSALVITPVAPAGVPNDLIIGSQTQKVPAQSIWCEICKIECNKEIFESHEQGKKHKKFLETLKAAVDPTPVAPAGVPNDPIICSQTQQVPAQHIWCEICKIECNSQGMLESHELGKKHKKNLKTLKSALVIAPVFPAGVTNDPIIGSHARKIPTQPIWCEICKIECNIKEMLESHGQGKKHKKNMETLKAALELAPVAPAGLPNNPIMGSQTQKVPAQPISCEICKIECNSKEMLESHEQGKKHKKNVETLKAAFVPAPIDPAGVPNDPIICSQTQKVTAQPMWCEICKIECNKEMLESHEPGNMHKNNLEIMKSVLALGPVAPAGVTSDPIIGSHAQKMPPQPIWCEIFKIECNNKGMLESHGQGKKHKKNLETLKAAFELAPVAPAGLPNDPIIGSQTQKVPAQPIWCEICKIECNSKEMLESHEQGNKHKKNLETLKSALALGPVAPAGVTSDPVIGSHAQKIPTQPIWCEICMIECNSKEMLKSHERGKKHKKNLGEWDHTGFSKGV